jgi:hypothetical protein
LQALGKLDLSGKLRLTTTAAGPLRPAPGTRIMDQVDYQVIAYPRELSARPLNWPASFTDVSGTVRANKDVITLENVEAQYHGDKFFLTAARIPLAHIDQEFRMQEMSGSAQLTGTVKITAARSSSSRARAPVGHPGAPGLRAWVHVPPGTGPTSLRHPN